MGRIDSIKPCGLMLWAQFDQVNIYQYANEFLTVHKFTHQVMYGLFRYVSSTHVPIKERTHVHDHPIVTGPRRVNQSMDRFSFVGR